MKQIAAGLLSIGSIVLAGGIANDILQTIALAAGAVAGVAGAVSGILDLRRRWSKRGSSSLRG
ncbi:MAG: hypothetical protein NW241_10880 [Bacteroidia bacterium]|nr:hypothetical protein [Bacteroidia bacterium]